MREPVLQLRGVDKSFGGLHAIAKLDVDVDRREIVSVIGPNGAGKTTLFNLITGVYPPDAGDIRFEKGASSAKVRTRSRNSGSRGRSRHSDFSRTSPSART